MTIQIKASKARGSWQVWVDGAVQATVSRKVDALAIARDLAILARQARESTERIRAERERS